MIILNGYKKEAALMVRLKKLSRVFGFTIGSENVESVNKSIIEESKDEITKLRDEIVELNKKLNSETKEPRKRRTKAEMEADKKAE